MDYSADGIKSEVTRIRGEWEPEQRAQWEKDNAKWSLKTVIVGGLIVGGVVTVGVLERDNIKDAFTKDPSSPSEDPLPPPNK